MDLRCFALRTRRNPSAARVDCNAQHVVRVLLEEALRVCTPVEQYAKRCSVVYQLAVSREAEVVAAVMATVSMHILELELVRRRRRALCRYLRRSRQTGFTEQGRSPVPAMPLLIRRMRIGR